GRRPERRRGRPARRPPAGHGARPPAPGPAPAGGTTRRRPVTLPAGQAMRSLTMARNRHPLDPGTADRLVAGALGPDDVPPGTGEWPACSRRLAPPRAPW